MKDTWHVYLSGPISGLDYNESVAWTNEAKNILWDQYGIEGYRPLRGKHFLKDKGLIGVHGYKDAIASQKGVYRRDKNDVKTSDAVLVNLLGAKRISIGTMFEMAWAEDNNVPVVLVMEDEGNCCEHMFPLEAAMYRVNNLEQAIELIDHILNDNQE
jgi:nucleoside 2-deoxyribosyltransferase